jgi:hypothetical protein
MRDAPADRCAASLFANAVGHEGLNVMDLKLSLPKCAGCKQEIIGTTTLTALGKMYHPLCWQKECNDYYFDQTLEGAPSDGDV